MISTSQDGRADGAVPIAEAARQLGTAPEALRKRLGRGTLRGEKRDGGWYIYLPNRADDGVPCPDDRPDSGVLSPDYRADDYPDGRDAVAGVDVGVASRLVVVEVRLAEVERQRDFLETELRRRDDDLTAALERLREAHLLLAQRPALPAGVTGPAASAATTIAVASRPWWAPFWPWYNRKEHD